MDNSSLSLLYETEIWGKYSNKWRCPPLSETANFPKKYSLLRKKLQSNPVINEKYIIDSISAALTSMYSSMFQYFLDL